LQTLNHTALLLTTFDKNWIRSYR